MHNPKEQPIRQGMTISRAVIGQFASFIAATGLLIGLIGVVWYGGLSDSLIAILAVGIAGIVLWAIATPAEFRDFITGRRARKGTIAVFSTVLFIGIITMIYIFVERAVITFDMTEARNFTLSPETHSVLQNVNREMRIVAFYSPELIAQRETDDQFFRLYEVESDGMITREYIDPIQEPARAELFAAQDGNVFLAYVGDDDEIDPSTITFVTMEGRQERDMTRAISRMLLSGNYTAYLDLSHGNLDPSDPTSSGMSTAAQFLQLKGFNVLPINLNRVAEDGAPMPDDASVLVIARPEDAFNQAEIDTIDAYLDQGGAVFIMADAQFTEESFLKEDSLFNNYLWDNWGIKMLDAVAVDYVAERSPLDVISAIIYDSPISADIDPQSDLDTRTQFNLARAIDVNTEPPVNNGVVILTNPETSYAETNLQDLALNNAYEFNEETDIPGPVPLVAFAIDANTDGRVLLVGDADFVTDGQIDAPLGNLYLFENGIEWLTNFSDEMVDIAPISSGFGQPLIFISPNQLDQIGFITMVIIPGLVLAVGAAVWFQRNRR